MSDKKDKYFVFQTLVDGVQTEVGRKVKGPGRPPVGPNIMKADDGNIYITDVRTTEPTDTSTFVEVELEDQTVWYEKQKPAQKNVTKRYSLDEDGNLVDEGAAGRGRPKAGYVKVTTDRVIDGVNLNGHFFNDGSEDEEVVVVDEVEVDDDDVVVDGYEEVEEDVVDEDDAELEAQAMADAAADFAADGGEFEEVEFEEEEETV